MVNTFLTIGAIAAATITVSGLLYKIFSFFKKMGKKIDSLDCLKSENKILVKSVFAICDGLIQQGCNGPVTKCREDLREYLINRED